MSESIVVLKEELAVFRVLLGVLLLTGIGLIGWFFLNPGHRLAPQAFLLTILICFYALVLFTHMMRYLQKIEELDRRQKGDW